MSDNAWRDIAPIIETGRVQLPLSKQPTDLDFTKTVGGTTFVVKSHFDKSASECITAKVARLTLRG